MTPRIVYPMPHLADGRKARETSGFGDERQKKDGSGTRLHKGSDILFRRKCAAERGGACPTDRFDNGRPFLPGRKHQGSKWHFVPHNWPIVASQDGEVIRAGPAGRSRVDEFCAVLHDVHAVDGANATGYVHLEPHSLTVSVGDLVRAGQVLGICGWGPTSVVHLHFDRWRGASKTGRGVQIDPMPYLELAEHIPCPPLACIDWDAVAFAGALALGTVAVFS